MTGRHIIVAALATLAAISARADWTIGVTGDRITVAGNAISQRVTEPSSVTYYLPAGQTNFAYPFSTPFTLNTPGSFEQTGLIAFSDSMDIIRGEIAVANMAWDDGIIGYGWLDTTTFELSDFVILPGDELFFITEVGATVTFYRP